MLTTSSGSIEGAPGGAIEIRHVGTQISDIQALIDAAQEMFGRDVILQIGQVEQTLLSFRQLPHHAVRPNVR